MPRHRPDRPRNHDAGEKPLQTRNLTSHHLTWRHVWRRLPWFAPVVLLPVVAACSSDGGGPSGVPIPPGPRATSTAQCHTGDCVIDVHAGTTMAFDPALGVSDLRVDGVGGDDGVRLVVHLVGNSSSSGCYGGCSASSGPDPDGDTADHASVDLGGTLVDNGLRIGVGAINGDRATLVISTEPWDPDTLGVPTMPQFEPPSVPQFEPPSLP